MIITHQLTFHLDHRTDTPTVEVVQGDTGRVLELSLLAQGASWEPPEGTQAAVRFRKSDGTGGWYDTMPDSTAACAISGSTVTVRLAPEVTTAAGITELQVVLRSGDTELATFTALLSVQADPSLDALDSESYANLSGWIQTEMDHRWESVFNNDGYINSKIDDLHFRRDAQFTAGTLSMVDGTETASETHIRSGFIANGGRDITVVMPEGVKAVIFFYDENYTYVSRSVYHYESFSTYFAAPYARCVAAYADDATITDPDALANKVAICYRGDAHDAFRGNVCLLGNKLFKFCTENGYYCFTAEDLPNILDAPAISCGGILEVIPHSGNNVLMQLIRTEDGELWFRIKNQPFQRILPPEAGAAGENGATFIPSVSDSGDLSWSNDMGLENPATVNIRGPQGEQGIQGEQGVQGEPGYTPVKGIDYLTDADKREIAIEWRSSLVTEDWTFTLEDDTVVTKKVVIL